MNSGGTVHAGRAALSAVLAPTVAIAAPANAHATPPIGISAVTLSKQTVGRTPSTTRSDSEGRVSRRGETSVVRDRHSGLPIKPHSCSLSSDASRHFGYTGTSECPPGTGRGNDALTGAYHEEEVPFRWMSSRRTTRSSISVT
jgi:hypothetical protein